MKELHALVNFENVQLSVEALVLRLTDAFRTLSNLFPVADWERFEVLDTIIHLTQR